MLIASKRKDIVGDYKHPPILFWLGVVALVITLSSAWIRQGHRGNLERLKKVKKEDFTMVREYTVALGSQRYLLQRPWPSDDFDFNGICDVAVMKMDDSGAHALKARIACLYS